MILTELLAQQFDLLVDQHFSGDEQPQALNIYLALSGGLDSVVLLDLLSKLNLPNIRLNLTAVYIDHQLQPDSKGWIKVNADLCKKYSIKFTSITVNIEDYQLDKCGIEAAARMARYAKFTDYLKNKTDILVTAHHLNDQAETFLLQLARASGPKGLSAMPRVKKLAGGLHFRPLLLTSRNDLYNYAVDTAHNLNWVEDKTNLDIKFDRNYIRHQVLPELLSRWPDFLNSVASSARYCSEHEAVLQEYLRQDLTLCLVDNNSRVLCVKKLKLFNYIKQKLILRTWFEHNNLLMPSEKVISQIINSCLNSRYDSNAMVSFNQICLKKNKDRLYLLENETVTAGKSSLLNKFNYTLGSILEIKELGLKIQSRYISNAHSKYKNKLLMLPQDQLLAIKFREGGENCLPNTRGGHVSLKKLLQENNIPPWQRDKIPLLYSDEQIVSVLGVANCKPFVSNTNEGWHISYEYVNNNTGSETYVVN